MSSLATPRLRSSSSSRETKPVKRLRLVAPPKSEAAKMPFVAVVIALLSAGLVGLIFLSTVLQSQSFEIAELNKKALALETNQQSLAYDLQRIRSPQRLAAAAVNLGMVPNTNPVFLRLRDGKVIGAAEPAKRDSNVLGGQG